LVALFAVALCAVTYVGSARVFAQGRERAEVKVGRYRLQSNAWVNLHQRLIHEAKFNTAPPASLAGDDLSKWKQAVEAYKLFLGKRSPIVDGELVRMNAALSATSASKLPASIPAAAVGADISKLSKELGVKPRYNLWHAILFYTSGELTRRALARRGVSDYQPNVLGMYSRGFGGFKQPLETHWQAYLDGKLSREEAIRRILTETTTPAKK
jgi:hypothetical protein